MIRSLFWNGHIDILCPHRDFGDHGGHLFLPRSHDKYTPYFLFKDTTDSETSFDWIIEVMTANKLSNFTYLFLTKSSMAALQVS